MSDEQTASFERFQEWSRRTFPSPEDPNADLKLHRGAGPCACSVCAKEPKQ